MCSDHQGWDQVGMVSFGLFKTIVRIDSDVITIIHIVIVIIYRIASLVTIMF